MFAFEYPVARFSVLLRSEITNASTPMRQTKGTAQTKEDFWFFLWFLAMAIAFCLAFSACSEQVGSFECDASEHLIQVSSLKSWHSGQMGHGGVGSVDKPSIPCILSAKLPFDIKMLIILSDISGWSMGT